MVLVGVSYQDGFDVLIPSLASWISRTWCFSFFSLSPGLRVCQSFDYRSEGLT